jgi:alkylation response protein AidB-like acyl-CoA dehydrogenase
MKIGGSFLTTPYSDEDKILTRESFPEDLKEMAEAMREYAVDNILPKKKDIETLNYDLLKEILRGLGEMGFLSIDIPERFGGMELDLVTSMTMMEEIAWSQSGSIAVTFGAHAGIGTLPIALFGTEEQKAKYLPDLATAEKIGAYCLTEPSAGSDALNIKTTAVLSEDGKHYILNGEKQFITNGGFADIYTVFAKVDGEKFTAFIVEREYPGVTPGKEEYKMGLKGSSTTSVRLENVKVPVENIIHEIGKGHEIAFNILNLGRIKLGVADLGGSKQVITNALKYAGERKQFGQLIREFDMIKSKFSDMAMRTYVFDAAAYNTMGMIKNNIDELDRSDPNYSRKALESLEQYAIEASMIKVFGSEYYGMTVDQALQVYGGYGFTEEYPAAQAYRDTRIERLYEGTNEVNRQVIAGYFLKKALMEQIPLRDKVRNLKIKLLKGETWNVEAAVLEDEKNILEGLKTLVILAFNEVIIRFGQSLRVEQMVMENLADAFTQLFFLESALKRATQAQDKPNADIHRKIVRLYAYDSMNRIMVWIKDVIFGTLEGPELRQALDIYNLFLNMLRLKDNFVQLKREVAEYLYQQGQYPFN